MGEVSSGEGGKLTHRRQLRFAMLPIGILLFVIGFLIAVSFSSGAGASEGTEDGEGLGIVSLTGIALSLSGVVVATAGPASLFLNRRQMR